MKKKNYKPKFKKIDWKKNKFWYAVKNSKGEYNLVIDEVLLNDFLIVTGFRNLFQHHSNRNKVDLIYVENNIFDYVTPDNIINFLFNDYIKSLPDVIHEEKDDDTKKTKKSFTRVQLANLFLKKLKTLINDDKLSTLPIIEPIFHTDSKSEMFFYFRNGIVKIDSNGCELIDYNNRNKISGLIWRKSIIEHGIELTSEEDTLKLDFSQFVMNTCIDRETNEFEQDRFDALMCTLGYLMHRYKSSATLKAVVFTEESLDDNPKGRTGKSLLASSLQYLRNVQKMDGKNFKPSNQFAFQGMDINTDIVILDDVLKSFPFEKLFSLITNGFEIENKNQAKIFLQPENSPKMIISTNYGIKGDSASFRARRINIELKGYYDDKNTPKKEFKRFFWDELYQDRDWNLFYNFMFMAAKGYFKNNMIIPEYESRTQKLKQLSSDLGLEFLEWIGSQKIESGKIYCSKDLKEEYIDFVGKQKFDISTFQFHNKLEIWATKNNWEFHKKDKVPDKHNKMQRGFMVIKPENKQNEQKLNSLENEKQDEKKGIEQESEEDLYVF